MEEENRTIDFMFSFVQYSSGWKRQIFFRNENLSYESVHIPREIIQRWTNKQLHPLIPSFRKRLGDATCLLPPQLSDLPWNVYFIYQNLPQLWFVVFMQQSQHGEEFWIRPWIFTTATLAAVTFSPLCLPRALSPQCISHRRHSCNLLSFLAHSNVAPTFLTHSYSSFKCSFIILRQVTPLFHTS